MPRMRSSSAKDSGAISPDANSPLVALRTCLYDHTVDDVPIIDQLPGHDHVTLCGPRCGAGFKFIPAYAEIAADFVEKGRTDLKRRNS